jgi:hypothetical protein
MRWRDEVVRLADVDRQIRRRSLLRAAPIEQLAPANRRHERDFLYAISLEVLQDRQLLRDTERLGILPDDGELLALWRQHPQLAPFLTSDLAATDQDLQQLIGLGVEDVYQLLRLDAARTRWLELVFERITDDELWEAYQRRQGTVTVDAVEVINTPSNQEIESFLAAPPEPSWVEDYYRSHLSQFTRPETRDVRIVRVAHPPDRGDAAPEAARQRAESLRQEVLAGADMVEMSSRRSDDPAAADGGLWMGVQPRQLPGAFDLPLGELSEVESDRFGAFFYRVEAIHGSRPRPLDRRLAREIAANYLSRARPNARPLGLAVDALEALATGDAERLQELEESTLVRRRVLGPLTQDEDGMVLDVGQAPELLDLIFELRPESPAAPRVVLAAGRLFAVRLLDRHEPTRAEYEAQRETFREQYRHLVRATAWDAYWATLTAEEAPRFEYPEALREQPAKP